MNPATGQVEDVPVRVLSNTNADPKKSDDDVVVWVNYACANIDREDPPNCLKDDDDRFILNSVDTFASDRHTGYGGQRPKYLGDGRRQPLGPRQQVSRSTPRRRATRSGTSSSAKTVHGEVRPHAEALGGLEPYEFKVDVPNTEREGRR